jgi:hypothetical protein
VLAREGKSEASAGVRIGRPMSRERFLFRTPTLVDTAEGKTGEARFRERPPVRHGRRPWHVRKLSVFREPGLSEGSGGHGDTLLNPLTDNLIAAEVVLADGRIIVADANDEEEFFGVRPEVDPIRGTTDRWN